MSGPFIQFELDAAKKAPLLADALGVHHREAVGGLALMWLHLYGEGKADTITAFMLKTFFGVDGKRAAEALTELGFLAPLGNGTWRVKGAVRYQRLSEVRREAGRKGAEKTNARRSAIAAAKVGKESAIADHDDREGDTSDGAKSHDSRSAIAAANGRQMVGKTDKKSAIAAAEPRQKAALDPRSEIRDLSPPPGERERDRAEHVASQEHHNSASLPRGPVRTAPLEGGASPGQSRYPPITAYDEPDARIGGRRVNGAQATPPPAPAPRKGLWSHIPFDPEFSERPE